MNKVKYITVKPDDAGIRLDKWFARNYKNISNIQVRKALRKGNIRVDGKRAKAEQKTEKGQIIRVPPFKEFDTKENTEKSNYIDKSLINKIKNAIIYKDSDIIAINKPSGIAVQGGSGIKTSVDDLLDHLKFDYEERPKLVHRLDKDTSGVLLLARTTAASARLTEFFRNNKIEKIYNAIVIGRPKKDKGKIDLPLIKGKKSASIEKMMVDEDEGLEAITYYKVIDTGDINNPENKKSETISLVELKPQTGRTHQLRVHMAETGTPILGDGKYGGKIAHIKDLSSILHLHASQVTLPSVNNSKIIIKAELPQYFKETIAKSIMKY